jgi:hypothetical protein
MRSGRLSAISPELPPTVHLGKDACPNRQCAYPLFAV